jgi:Condensation domain
MGIIATAEGGRNAVTESVIVQFAGDGSGVSDLSWGQAEIWSVMQDKADSLPMGGARALPPGATVADVAAGLTFILSRHQALRTRLRCGPDERIQQVVHGSGEIALEVVDAGAGDPAEVAAAVAAGYRARPFDLSREWPLRMAVITQRDTATHIAEMVCHIALDSFGQAALHDDFDRRGERTGPVTAAQPLEQAERQRGPAGRRASEASLRYVERLAPGVPDLQFRPSGDPRRPRFWQVTIESPASYRAVRTIAARLGVSTSPVLLAAFAVALTDLTACPRAALHLVVSNRFRPGFAGSVSPVMQSCLCVLEVAGAPFDEVVRRAWQSALGAYKHAYFDPAAKRELCERLAAERGAEPDWDVIFNDRRVHSRDPAGEVDGDGAPPLRDELTRTTLTWGGRNDMPQQKVFLNICDAPGTLQIELWADTHFVRPADMAGLLQRIEGVLVAAAPGDGGEATAVAAMGTAP